MALSPEAYERKKECIKKRVLAIRADRISRHCCVKCGCQDDRTISGKTMCEPCAKKHAAYMADYHWRKWKEERTANELG